MGKVKSKKRKRSSSTDSSSSSSDSSREKKKLRKLKKKLKKEQKKTERALKKKLKEKKKLKRNRRSKSSSKSNESKKKEEEKSCDVPIALLEISKAMAPMTKEEWERRQSVVRKVMDEETGRYRLIKGDGEVLEEIVSRSRQKEINRNATRADGAFFQSQTMDREYL